MIHLDLQHHIYLREEGFYKDFVNKTYIGTVKSAVLPRKVGETRSLSEYTSKGCMLEDVWNLIILASEVLHHFSDASELGYEQGSYIRMVNEVGRVHCSLLLGKSRVAPQKFISMPRLELNAAFLSVKMAWLLKKELKLEEIKEWFWTDSIFSCQYFLCWLICCC